MVSDQMNFHEETILSKIFMIKLGPYKEVLSVSGGEVHALVDNKNCHKHIYDKGFGLGSTIQVLSFGSIRPP